MYISGFQLNWTLSLMKVIIRTCCSLVNRASKLLVVTELESESSVNRIFKYKQQNILFTHKKWNFANV